MSTKKDLTTITYVYQDVNAYIQQDKNTEAIIETFCINTNKSYCRTAFIDIITNEFIVEYIMMKI